MRRQNTYIIESYDQRIIFYKKKEKCSEYFTNQFKISKICRLKIFSVGIFAYCWSLENIGIYRI